MLHTCSMHWTAVLRAFRYQYWYCEGCCGYVDTWVCFSWVNGCTGKYVDKNMIQKHTAKHGQRERVLFLEDYTCLVHNIYKVQLFHGVSACSCVHKWWLGCITCIDWITILNAKMMLITTGLLSWCCWVNHFFVLTWCIPPPQFCHFFDVSLPCGVKLHLKAVLFGGTCIKIPRTKFVGRKLGFSQIWFR